MVCRVAARRVETVRPGSFGKSRGASDRPSKASGVRGFGWLSEGIGEVDALKVSASAARPWWSARLAESSACWKAGVARLGAEGLSVVSLMHARGA